MINRNRRTFLLQVAATGAVLSAGPARAQAGPKLEENDPLAASLGYKMDTTKVDGKKYPKHDAAQHCATCQLFQGKAGDTAGACSLFAGKQVMATGWCSAWAKKA